MKKILIAFFTIAVVVFSTTPASAVVDVEGRYWFSSLDSNIRSGAVGTDIDLVDTLGMNEKENFFDGRIVLELGSHSLRYGYMPLEWKGTGSSAVNISYNGQNYAQNVAIDSELSLKYHRFGYQYNFIDTLDNHFGVIAEIKYFDIDAKLQSSLKNESISVAAPIPALGLSAQVSIPFLLKIGGEVTGMSLGNKAYMYDAEVSVAYKTLPLIDIAAGYRAFKVHAEDGNDEFDIDLTGPFFMLRGDF